MQPGTRETGGESLKRVGLYALANPHMGEVVQQRLVQAGCQVILTMEMGFENSASETPLWAMLNPGDTVVVVTLAHLDRSLAQLTEWLDALAAHQVTVWSLEEDIDTARDMGSAFGPSSINRVGIVRPTQDRAIPPSRSNVYDHAWRSTSRGRSGINAHRGTTSGLDIRGTCIRRGPSGSFFAGASIV